MEAILADLAPPPWGGARIRLAMGAGLEAILASLQTLQGLGGSLGFLPTPSQ